MRVQKANAVLTPIRNFTARVPFFGYKASLRICSQKPDLKSHRSTFLLTKVKKNALDRKQKTKQ